MDVGPGELIIVGIVLLLVFGGAKIPQLARNLGLAKSEFEKGMQGGEQAEAETSQPETSQPETSQAGVPITPNPSS